MNEQPKKQYWFYRILGIVDNFISILFLFSVLVNFVAMGFHPYLLFYVFVAFSVLVYTNLTAVFARHVMVRGNFLRLRLRDWIRVNAFVTIIFSGFMTLMLTIVLLKPAYVEAISEQVSFPAASIRHGMMALWVCMVLLAIHVIMTFRYLRLFRDAFRDQEP